MGRRGAERLRSRFLSWGAPGLGRAAHGHDELALRDGLCSSGLRRRRGKRRTRSSSRCTCTRGGLDGATRLRAVCRRVAGRTGRGTVSRDTGAYALAAVLSADPRRVPPRTGAKPATLQSLRTRYERCTPSCVVLPGLLAVSLIGTAQAADSGGESLAGRPRRRHCGGRPGTAGLRQNEKRSTSTRAYPVRVGRGSALSTLTLRSNSRTIKRRR